MKCRMLYRRCASFFSSLWRRVSHIALSRGISRVLRSFGLCFVAVLALTFSPLFSSSVSAAGFNLPSNYYLYSNSAGRPFMYATDSGHQLAPCRNTEIPTGSYGSQQITIDLSIYDSNACNSYFTIPAGAIIQVQIRTLGMIFVQQNYTDANNRFMSVGTDTVAGSVDMYYTLWIWNQQGTVYNGYIDLSLTFFNQGSTSKFQVESWNIYAPTSTIDYSGSLSNINSNIQGLISGVGSVQDSVNSAADQAHQDSQAEIDAINEQTQQQQDQYEQEKEEENQREDEMDGQASQAESMFSFTFLNPFIGIFELFNDSGCVSIPTIAGMVGSDETTYCPWFDSSVRNVLTPVFGFSSMILLFGFVIYWLRGGSSDILYKGGK